MSFISHQSSVFKLIIGLQPKQEVTLHALTTIDNGNKFESLAHYTAGMKGEC